MTAHYLRIALAASLTIGALSAQNQFDTSGNNTLKGDYFIREVFVVGNDNGNNNSSVVTAAASVIGVATFDGAGNYTFKGQGATLSGGANSSVSFSGGYSVAGNGFMIMDSPASTFGNGADPNIPLDTDFGGVSAVGPLAFVASATEGGSSTSLIAIPGGSGVSNGSFSGSYTAGSIDFLNASLASVHQATLALTADGSGNLGTVPVTGFGVDLGGTALNQTIPGATYALSGEGSGTINLGAATGSQLVSGTKTFYISADKNIVLGGSPSGFDMFVGLRALNSGASNASLTGVYFESALEEGLDTTQAPVEYFPDGFYGSMTATGSGTSLFHNRIAVLGGSPYDYTYDSQYTIQGNGTTVPPTDIPYTFNLGANGQGFIAVGTVAGSQPLYSLTVGLAAQTYTPSGVFLNPLGVVSSASFSPATNPIAPNEFVTLFGSNLAGTTATATTLPLPTSLGGVQVTFNGTQAPLSYVSPGQITVLVPSSITPDPNVSNPINFATVQVTNNGTLSNQVTMYTSQTAPGVFAQSGIGAAAAQHADYSLITDSHPANAGETVIIYGAGLGITSPAPVPDGAAAPSSPLSSVPAQSVTVDFSGTYFTDSNGNFYPVFAGLTPTAAGLYQINQTIPAGAGSSAFIDVSTPDGYASQATMALNSPAAALAPRLISAEEAGKRRPLHVSAKKNPATRARGRTVTQAR